MVTQLLQEQPPPRPCIRLLPVFHEMYPTMKFERRSLASLLGVLCLGSLFPVTTAFASTCTANQDPVTSVCTDLVWSSGDINIRYNVNSAYSNAVRVSGNAGTLTNHGQIYSTYIGGSEWSGAAVSVALGNVTAVMNYELIQSTRSSAIGVRSGYTLSTFYNSRIVEGYTNGVYNAGTISSLTNEAGTIFGDNNNGVRNDNTGTIGTLTNNGAIFGNVGGYGVLNNGSIITLNNAQGGNGATPSTTALTMYGTLPQTYNIIISSSTHYGQLVTSSSTGSMNFGISSLSTTGSSIVGTFPAVLNGVTNTALGISGVSLTNATSNGYTYNLVETGVATNIWDLTVLSAPVSGPTLADTQSALQQSAAALRNVFNQQTSVIHNSLGYDCTALSDSGVCVSGGGRLATRNSITGEQLSTLLVGAFQVTNNIRVGGFIDQNASSPNINGITIGQAPMYGIFGVWNHNPDRSGYEVRLSGSWSNQSITQTRNVVGTSEAGTGSSSLNSQALSGVVSYAMAVPDSSWIANPYAGIRKTRITRGAYTESNAVTSPLTYSDLTQDIITALMGVRMNKRYGNDLFVTASIGIEQNVGSNIDTLNASGVTGLTATDFSANYARTRPVASVGASYAIGKNQRISLNAMYRKEAFQSSGSTVGILMYQMGL